MVFRSGDVVVMMTMSKWLFPTTPVSVYSTDARIHTKNTKIVRYYSTTWYDICTWEMLARTNYRPMKIIHYQIVATRIAYQCRANCESVTVKHHTTHSGMPQLYEKTRKQYSYILPCTPENITPKN